MRLQNFQWWSFIMRLNMRSWLPIMIQKKLLWSKNRRFWLRINILRSLLSNLLCIYTKKNVISCFWPVLKFLKVVEVGKLCHFEQIWPILTHWEFKLQNVYGLELEPAINDCQVFKFCCCWLKQIIFFSKTDEINQICTFFRFCANFIIPVS